jgi:hypothetical protein
MWLGLTASLRTRQILGSPDKYPASIRNTKYDAMVIALFVGPEDFQRIPNGMSTYLTASHLLRAIFYFIFSSLKGHFDGVYTYFATDGFTHGSTTSNWPRLASVPPPLLSPYSLPFSFSSFFFPFSLAPHNVCRYSFLVGEAARDDLHPFHRAGL